METTQIKILWQVQGYTDFEIEEYNLIFRIWKEDLQWHLNHIEKNIEFFKYFEQEGFQKILRDCKTFANWGNGWEWEERYHKKQHKEYRLDNCVSWYTLPYGSKLSECKTMDSLYSIEQNGITLEYSYNSNRQPQNICYCFRKIKQQ